MLDLLKESIEIKTKGIFLIVLGPSGAGKSHFCGTYPGKVLYLYGAGESHGPSAAAKTNKDMIAVAWDRTPEKELSPDEILPRLKKLLDPEMLIKAGIKCVALDSWTNLAADVKRTAVFKQRCQSAKGTHNPFKETEAQIEILSSVVRQFQVLVDFKDIDVITTLDLQIQSIADDGLILESKPSLPTFGVAKSIVQTFPDILVLGRMGEKREPTFQNFAKTAASSVDRETGKMVKYIEFNPRLRGVDVIPESMKPDVKEILKLKGLK